jgi:hypothetical protein
VIGTLALTGSAAIFSGTEYLSCIFPSYSAEVASLAPMIAIPTPSCACTNPNVSLYGTLAVNSTSINPIFTDINGDMQAYISVDTSSGTPSAQSHLYLNQPRGTSPLTPMPPGTVGIYSSTPWPVDPVSNRVWFGSHPVDFWHVAGLRSPVTSWFSYLVDPDFDLSVAKAGNADFLHWSGGTVAPPATTIEPFTKFTMNTGIIDVFIGHNPSNGSFLNGEIYQLSVDPGCWGH